MVTKATESSADAKDIVIKAYQKLLEAKSCHISVDSVTTLSRQGYFSRVHDNEEIDLFLKPLLSKKIIKVALDFPGTKSNMDMEQYVEESNDRYTVYTKDHDLWKSQSLPRFDPLRLHTGGVEIISKATLLREDTDSTTFKVVSDASGLQKTIGSSLAMLGIQQVHLTTEQLKPLGDISYIVTIDKKTMTIARIENDLSAMSAILGDVLADSKDIPEAQKQLVLEIFRSVKANLSVAFSQLNSVKRFSIPAEAKAVSPDTPGQQQTDNLPIE